MAYVGNQPARGQWRKLSDISSAFDGVITTFTTSVPPGTSEYFVTAGSASQLLISLGGVIQEPDVDYTVSTNSVTFTTPPTSGLSFFGVLCGDALNTGVPADGSVTTSKLAGGLSVGLTGGSASNPSLFFTGDDNTGVFSAGGDQLNITTNGVERVEFGTSEVVFNDGGENYDFRVEGDTEANLLFVDAGNDEVSFRDDVKVDSSGRLLVGTSSARGNFFNTTGQETAFQVEGTTNQTARVSFTRNSNNDGSPLLIFGKTRATSVGGNTVVSSGDQLGGISFQGADGTELVQAANIIAEVDGTPGANDMPGRLVFSTTADGASSPTERMRIQQNGFIGFGKASEIGSIGSVVGVDIIPNGYLGIVRSAAPCMAINRNTNDGVLIQFYQDQIEEGSISVSGTTVSYNGAHLSRWSQLPSGTERTEILRGSVLSNIDEMCEWTDEENEQLNRMKVSDVEGDKNVSGVFQAWDDDDDTYTNDFYCAMTGDFIIRIAADTTVERGDLLMSAGDGTAKPQDDDIIRSKTIAKVTSTNVSCTYDDGSYCVPCVLMAC